MAQTQRIIRNKALAWITPVVFLIGVAITATFAQFTTEALNGPVILIHSAFFVLWVSVYCFFGFKIVQNRDYLVIERFGKFNRIVHSGPRILCFPGLIDKVLEEGTLRNQEIELFADEDPPYKVDFTNGSTGIKCKAWYRVGPKEGADLKEVDKAIYDFTYSLDGKKEVRERIEDVLESSFVPMLQKLSIDEALLEKDTVSQRAVTLEVRRALETNGIELIEEMSFIITDIVLPEEVIKQRQKLLEGESEANKQQALGSGYANAVAGIIISAKKAGKDVSWEEAQAFYERQRGLDTLATTGSKITFVAADMKGIQKTMGILDANNPS